MAKFRKSGERRINKNGFFTNSRKTYGRGIAVCGFVFKTKLLNLLSFL